MDSCRTHHFVVVLLVSITAATEFARAQEAGPALDVKARGLKNFYLDTAAGRNQISIFSESALEDLTIVCNQVNGEWHVDPQSPEQIRGQFSVRVADLRTGVELRDRHLRGPEWLDAPKFPMITVTIERGEDVRKVAPNTVSMNLVGKMTLHGVTRDVRIPCTLTYLDESPLTMQRTKGDLTRIRAEWPLKLADFNVKGPPASDTIGLTVSDALQVKVSIFGSTEKPARALEVERPTTLPAGVATQPGAGAELSILQAPTQTQPSAGR